MTTAQHVAHALSRVTKALESTEGANLHPGVRSHLLAAEVQLVAAECLTRGQQPARRSPIGGQLPAVADRDPIGYELTS